MADQWEKSYVIKRERGLDGLPGSQKAGLKLFLQPVGSRGRSSVRLSIILYIMEMSSEALIKMTHVQQPHYYTFTSFLPVFVTTSDSLIGFVILGKRQKKKDKSSQPCGCSARQQTRNPPTHRALLSLLSRRRVRPKPPPPPHPPAPATTASVALSCPVIK